MNDKRVRVLLIEDDPGNSLLIQKMLSRSRPQAFDLTCAECLKAGVDLLRSDEPDVVLLDLGLPESQGIDTLNKLQSQTMDIPVVILTGLYDEEVAIEAVKTGAQDYLVKGQVTDSVLARSLHYAIERKTLEESLKESEAKYRNLVESSSDLIVILQGGVIKFANRQAFEMLGYFPDEAIETPFSNYISPEEAEAVLERYSRHVSGESSPEKCEMTLIHRNGDHVSVEISGRIIRYQGESAYMVIIHDITDRKRAEEQLRTAHAKLQEAHEKLKASQAKLLHSEKMAALGQLVSGVAHELNNPLMAISGYCELMVRELEDRKLASFASNLHQETKRAIDIVKNLLSFAREHETTEELLSVKEVLESVIKLRSYEMNLDKIEVEASIEPELPEVLGNFNQLQQVFLNIILNAEQATKAKSDSGKISVETRMENGYVIVELSDNGPGIPVEIQDRIFEPFFTTKEVGKGTGLGLSICYGIVRDHKGTISCYSKVGDGATFEIGLPVAAQNETEKREARNTAKSMV